MWRIWLVSSSAWVYLRTRADGETGIHPISHNFNLSQLKVLRSLEVRGWAFNFGPTRRTIVMEVFSTITSPVFSELVILIRDDEAVRLLSEVTLFETLHTMNEIRPFKLVFLLIGGAQRDSVGALDLAIARGFFDFFDTPPTIPCGRFHNGWWDTSFD